MLAFRRRILSPLKGVAKGPVCVGHQLLVGHPDFPFPKGHAPEKTMLQALNSVAAAGSRKRLGLSFTPLPEPPIYCCGGKIE